MIRFTQRVSYRSVLTRVLRRLCGNERGNITIVAAFSLPVLIGFGGLAVDASMWLKASNSVQGAADAAAIAVAAAVTAGDTPTRWQTEGYAVAAQNGYTNGQTSLGGQCCVTVTVHNPPVSPSAFAGNAAFYQVIISAPQKLYLANVVSDLIGTIVPPTVTGRAVAVANTNPTCILALDPLAPPAGTITTNGGATSQNLKCAIYDDSTGAKSINTAGGGSISAPSISTMGNYDHSGNITVTASPNTVQIDQPYAADPYRYTRSIPPSSSWGNPSNQSWNNNTINNPTGVIQFQGDITVKGTVHLDPGIYIITDNPNSHKGSLTMSNGATLIGTGVTIIITSTNPSADKGVFKITGGTLQLTAPSTGSTAGIALWTDRNIPYGVDTIGTGGGTSFIKGAIYAPTHQVKYAGNNLSSSTGCTQLVAYDIVITGASYFAHDCNNLGILDVAINQGLVE